MSDQYDHTTTLPRNQVSAGGWPVVADPAIPGPSADRAGCRRAEPASLRGDTLADILAAVVAAAPGAEYADIIGGHIDPDGNVTWTPVYPAGGILGQLHTVACDDPSAAALREHHPLRIDDMATERRWPVFRGEANALGVSAMLCLPLLTDDGTVGVLTLYACTPRAFTDDDQTLVAVFTTAAAAALRALAQRENLASALAGRDALEQATGLLMTRNGLTADQASKLLADTADDSNITRADLARRLITEAPAGTPQTAAGADPDPRLSKQALPTLDDSPGANAKFACTRTDTREAAILHVRGEIDFVSAPAFQTALCEVLLAGTDRGVVLDLSEVGFIDTVGLAALAEHTRGTGASSVSVVGAHPVLRPMHALGLDRHLTCLHSLDEAGPFTPIGDDGVDGVDVRAMLMELRAMSFQDPPMRAPHAEVAQ